MIEFVGLLPILKNYIRGCHGNNAFSHSSNQSFKDNFASHSAGPTEQFGMILKGHRSAR